MSGSRLVMTSSWLSWSWRSFLWSSSVYSCHLFLVSSASVRSIPFLSFIEPIFAWNIPLVFLIFLKRSLVFPVLFFSSISLHWKPEEGFLISPCYSLEICIQMLISLLFSFAFCIFFFSQLFVRPPQTTTLPFCISWGWSWSLPPCTTSQTSVHTSSGTLSGLIPWIYLLLPPYNCKGFDLGHTELSSGFPYCLQFKSEFGNKEFMIWATVSSWSCFCRLYRAPPSLAAKNRISLILVLTIWWCPCVESSLVLLEEGVCYDQCIFLAKLY